MRDSPRYKKGRYDQIILDVLRGAPLSRNELLDLRKDPNSKLSQIPYSTLDQRLKQLERSGFIKHITDYYKILEDKDADSDEVQECIEVIRNEEEQEHVIQDRIKHLRILSKKNRIATLSNVMCTIEECLENPKILDCVESFEELTFMLKNILDFERKHRLQGSEKIIEELTSRVPKKVIDHLDKKPDFPGARASRFLAASGKREAVEIFFKKIRTLSKFNENQIEELGYNLKLLYPKHQRIINSHIDDLLRSEDELYQKIAKKLQETILRG